MKRYGILLFALCLSVASAMTAQSVPNEATAVTGTFTAVLLGSNEPNGGDPIAVGFATVTVDESARTVSFTLSEAGVAAPTAAHIHRGPSGVNGQIVVPFNFPFNNGFASGTVTNVDDSLIREIVANPSNFYANIHNAPFPGGAIRGQLMAAPGTTTGTCLADSTTLCLNQGRFKVQVAFQTATAAGIGKAIPLTGDTGAFWFFSQNNLELMVKVVDGRAVNGKFWFFSGGLSDVGYAITVTDLTTGTVRTYAGPRGTQSALNDTSAF
ncbi:MAG: CHRD domain-containing protein [Acidobacteria bacterium]|nr:CHRD domain-containing protein [Acidobacteriota bacterium]MCA1612010.1 CHRD domain-containing protein [Acidobacteriota bacterium]